MFSYLKHSTFKAFRLVALCSVFGCSDPAIPKPYGYMRLEYPKPEYDTFSDQGIPITFLKSIHTKFIKVRSYWANMHYTIMPAEVHLTYTPIRNNLHTLLKEVQKITYEHTIKADAIVEIPFENPGKKVYGMLYELTGEAASPVQFYLTDSTHHIVSGSLYFNSEPKPDSLMPAINYIKKDLTVLVETLEWTK